MHHSFSAWLRTWDVQLLEPPAVTTYNDEPWFILWATTNLLFSNLFSARVLLSVRVTEMKQGQYLICSEDLRKGRRRCSWKGRNNQEEEQGRTFYMCGRLHSLLHICPRLAILSTKVTRWGMSITNILESSFPFDSVMLGKENSWNIIMNDIQNEI